MLELGLGGLSRYSLILLAGRGAKKFSLLRSLVSTWVSRQDPFVFSFLFSLRLRPFVGWGIFAQSETQRRAERCGRGRMNFDFHRRPSPSGLYGERENTLWFRLRMNSSTISLSLPSHRWSWVTISWCRLNWSTLANPVLFVQLGRWHLYILLCFCKCALPILSALFWCNDRGELVTHLNSELRLNTTSSPFLTPPLLHSWPWGQTCSPFPRLARESINRHSFSCAGSGIVQGSKLSSIDKEISCRFNINVCLSVDMVSNRLQVTKLNIQILTLSKLEVCIRWPLYAPSICKFLLLYNCSKLLQGPTEVLGRW